MYYKSIYILMKLEFVSYLSFYFFVYLHLFYFILFSYF